MAKQNVSEDTTMPTNHNVDKSTAGPHRSATRTFATLAAFVTIAVTLALSGTVAIPMAAAQTTEPEGFDQTTSPASLADQNETRRLSVLGALGISLIEDVKVTAVALNEDGTEVTITVSRADNATTALDTDNQTDTATPGITVAAFRTQLDLAGLLQAHMMGRDHGMSMYSDQGSMQDHMMMQMQNQSHMAAGKGMPMFDIVSFIENLEIGSSIEEEGWTSPTELVVPVIGGEEGEENGTGIMTGQSGSSSDTEVVVVLVIPYTGETEPAGQTVGEQQGSTGFP